MSISFFGYIVVCYGWGGRLTTNFGGVDVVPLLAIAGCYGWGQGKDHFWRSGRGAIAVPLQSADLCFISSFYVQGHQFHPDTQGNNNEFCFELLADVTLLSTLMKKQELLFAIWGLCWYNSFLVV